MRKDLFYDLLLGSEEGDYLASLYFDYTLYGSAEKDAWYLTLNAFLLGHTMRFLDNEVLEEGQRYD